MKEFNRRQGRGVACPKRHHHRFQMPKFSKPGALDWIGIYDVACVLFLFPLIILCGAHSNAGTGMIRLCKFSGRLSYLFYITHIAFVYVLTGHAWTRNPRTAVIIFWIFIALPLAIAVAWFFLRFFDEPMRAWLTRRYGIKPTTVLPEQSGAAR